MLASDDADRRVDFTALGQIIALVIVVYFISSVFSVGSAVPDGRA